MSDRTTSLHRPDEGRWLAGVAAGLALRLAVSVWLIRIVFGLLCFAGGLGVFLYVAGWLLIPSEGETESIAQGWVGTGQARQWAGVILVGLAIIILASETRLIRGDLAFAVVLIGIGVMLYRGDLGRGGRRPTTPQSTDREEPPEATAEATTASESAAAESSAVPAVATAQPVAVSAVATAEPVPVRPRERSYLGRVFVGVAVIALGVLGLLDTIFVDLRPDFYHYVALAVGVIGIGVVVGAWFGRTGGLILLGFVLIPILFLSRLLAAGGVDVMSIDFTSVGDIRHRPVSVEAIRARYELGIGGLTIDLREVDFEGRTVQLETEVGIGEVHIRLPEGVAADVSGQVVGVGALGVGDWDHGGIGVEADLLLEGIGGTLVLDAQVGVGQVKVDGFPVDRLLYPSRVEDAAFEDEYRISDPADLRSDYTLTSGSLRLDLGGLVLEDDRSVRVAVGRGDVWVVVPRDMGLQVTGRVDRGRLTLFDEVRTGSSMSTTYSRQVFGASRLTLDIRVEDGDLTVVEER
ncbi:MAG: PspC domain-containing protein [Actinomycetia bacterium]|nr:PspC domain-containing protein [Actinomycetes bacterium]